jgi:hydrogenase maturation protein HypF
VLTRRAVRVRGTVQGVGFRPFVFRLARDLLLSGFVRNDAQGVEIEVQGAADELARFETRLWVEAPALARIDAVETDTRLARPETEFVIHASRSGAARTGVAADVAVCRDCLTELFDATDRRYRYPFVNCTQCGPRYTITRALPYDRPNTSMAGFVQCPTCQAEYDDPRTRRFHAQPNACPACGPRLSLLDPRGAPFECTDPIAQTLACLRSGQIVAIKGLGGFHLACDARNAQAVAALRRRKDREEKPFALMAANVASLAPFAIVDPDTQVLLESRERPIVLLAKARGRDEALPGVAPGLAQVGAMLPCTPLQYLLFHEAASRPDGVDWLERAQPLVLVMTSANPSGEPLVIGNEEAVARLGRIADAVLIHDRDILVRCDDSVVRVRGTLQNAPSPPCNGGEGRGEGASESHRNDEAARAHRFAFVRRARGYTPQAIKLPRDGPAVLAMGGWLKNTVCVTRGDEAFLSQHIGDLDNAATCVAMEEAAAHLMAVLQVRPEAVAHDLHPDFHSSRFAARLAQAHDIPAIPVQHHHAHIAAVLAEHGVAGPALGLALDGVGLGEDGAAWGGELLRVEGARMQRLAHLRALPLPGGERAAREPWRMATAALHALGRGEQAAARYRDLGGETVMRMLECGLNCPVTSSAGRWFDAAAGLLGVKQRVSYEGQAAMLLEGLAARHGPVAPLHGGFAIGADGTLDLLPLLGRLADPIEPAEGAALFHSTLAHALAHWALVAAQREAVTTVALGGGCFLNTLLCAALHERLTAAGLRVLQAQQAPPNDGGLALGQAWVAMQTAPHRPASCAGTPLHERREEPDNFSLFRGGDA